MSKVIREEVKEVIELKDVEGEEKEGKVVEGQEKEGKEESGEMEREEVGREREQVEVEMKGEEECVVVLDEKKEKEIGEVRKGDEDEEGYGSCLEMREKSKEIADIDLEGVFAFVESFEKGEGEEGRQEEEGRKDNEMIVGGIGGGRGRGRGKGRRRSCRS